MPDLSTIAEVTRRSEALWLGVPGTRPRLVWHLWHGGALYVVGGGAEQPLPALTDRAVVVVRSRARPTDRALQWDADVSVVAPATPAWDDIAPRLAAARLNAPDNTDLPARWATTGSRVVKLTPANAAPAPGSSPSRPAPPTR